MNLYEYIFKRKSTRKYNMISLDDATITKITAFADTLKPLFPEIKTAYEITTDAKNLLPIKAPYYFMLSSEKNGDYLQNIGFMWQQMDLYLSSLGLGSCWLGMAKPTNDTKTKYPFIIALCFGKSENSPYRELSHFNRKQISEISNVNDNRVEAARLAPSATNSQNWFFESTGTGIDVYQKKVNPLMVAMYDKMNKVDMGIALCHISIATQHEGRSFIFEKKTVTDKKGYIYTGTVK